MEHITAEIKEYCIKFEKIAKAVQDLSTTGGTAKDETKVVFKEFTAHLRTLGKFDVH